MAAAFGESEDAGGDARAPSLGPRLRDFRDNEKALRC